MQKVNSPSLALCHFPTLIEILRHLVITVAPGFTHPDKIRFDKPQLALGPLGH